MRFGNFRKMKIPNFFYQDECFFDVMKQLGLIGTVVQNQEEITQRIDQNQQETNRKFQELSKRIGIV